MQQLKKMNKDEEYVIRALHEKSLEENGGDEDASNKLLKILNEGGASIFTKEEATQIQKKSNKKLANFSKFAFKLLHPNEKYISGWAIDLMCEHLEAVSRGDILRLLINVPPGCMKSLLTTVFFPAYEWGPLNNQSLKYLTASHNLDLTHKNTGSFLQLIKNPYYEAFYPIELEKYGIENIQNTQYGEMRATSSKSVTGFRAHRVIVDDPHQINKGSNDGAGGNFEAQVIEFRQAIQSRTANNLSAIIVIMQRVSVGDVSDVAMELGYKVLKLPMLFEKGESKWVTGLGDPRTKDGELLFPEKFPEETVESLKLALGQHAFATQCQQSPFIQGGGIIQEVYFDYYSRSSYLADGGRYLYRFITSDTAVKDEEQHDYTVFSLWGKGYDLKLYLIDLLRIKVQSNLLPDHVVSFYRKHKKGSYMDDILGPLTYFYVEDKSSGSTLIQTLKKDDKIPVKGIARGKASKSERARNLSPILEAKSVVLPNDCKFTADFIDECVKFTGKSNEKLKDDQVDTLLDAIDIALCQNKQQDIDHIEWLKISRGKYISKMNTDNFLDNMNNSFLNY